MSLNSTTGDLYNSGSINTSAINSISGITFNINATGEALLLNSYNSNIGITSNTGNISIAAEFNLWVSRCRF